jgi:hypothetical protein
MTKSRAFADPASEAPGLLEGGTGQALAGHGYETSLTGTFVVPSGTTVYVPPAGLELPESIGQAIEAGRWWEVAAHPERNALVQSGKWRIFGPESEMPNLVLYPGEGLTMYRESIRVDEPGIPIDQLLKPNMGHIFWAACSVPFPGAGR